MSPAGPAAAAGAAGAAAAADELAALVLRRAVELAVIPAPPGTEQRRADLVRTWWEHDGRAPRIDAVGNVWAQIAGSASEADSASGAGGGVLVCAHLDTVFAADAPHEVLATPGRLTGPSVGDDSIGVAALSAVAALVRTDRGTGPLWIVATVGEEGMGNLAGIRHALAHAPQPLAAVIAIEGNYLGRVVTTGVGSVRLRVAFRGPGGHAWERAGAPSAVHAAAGAAALIGRLAGPPGARCSVNIGRIGGGEAINARARDAWFEVDLRADSMPALAELEEQARRIIAEAVADASTGGPGTGGPSTGGPSTGGPSTGGLGTGGVSTEVTELGRRPAGSISTSSPLARAAAAALAAVGIEPEFGATSTDANAAHAAGIPAVALGVTTGQGEHTPSEWIETAGVPAGLTALAATIEQIREGRE